MAWAPVVAWLQLRLDLIPAIAGKQDLSAEAVMRRVRQALTEHLTATEIVEIVADCRRATEAKP
jgi:SRSO17 transposase